MPIITVQRRMAEHGRIRLGQKVTGTNRQGKEYTRPAKLDRFRFTSASQRLIEEIAAKYGGTAQQWDNAGKAEWEVISDATSIPVIVVKGGFSQWHEHWTKAGLQHRCDGEKDAAGEYCDPDDPTHAEAIKKPTTRLSVMLSEIESLGVWRMESKGWNAAAELPSMAELAMHVGDLVPATLGLAERSAIVQTDQGPQTSRFVVPFLDLHVTKARLVELVGGPGGVPAIGAAADQPAALPAGQGGLGGDAYDYYFDAVADAETLEQMSAIWSNAVAAKLVGVTSAESPRRAEFIAAWQGRAHEIKDEESTETGSGGNQEEGVEPGSSAPSTTTGESAPNEDGTYDAVVVEDADAIWERIVRAGGERGMSLPDIEDDFTQQMGGLVSSDAAAEELDAYLKILTARSAA